MWRTRLGAHILPPSRAAKPGSQLEQGFLPVIVALCQDLHSFGGKSLQALLDPDTCPDTLPSVRTTTLSYWVTHNLSSISSEQTPPGLGRKLRYSLWHSRKPFHHPSHPGTRSSPYGRGVFCVASYYRMNSCGPERLAAKSSPSMTGI